MLATVKRAVLVGFCSMIFAAGANANVCKIPQINGIWETGFLSVVGAYTGFCAFEVKGRNLLPGSGCVVGGNPQFQNVTSSNVTLDKELCVMGIEAIISGEFWLFLCTLDKGRSVGTCLYENADTGEIGEATLVKVPES